MTPSVKSHFQLSSLETLHGLMLKAEMIVAGTLEGFHKSFQAGFNVEFKEYREYFPGNDPRSIDWKLFGRTDELYIRVKESETNINSYVLVDCSGSMDYQSERAKMTKWQYAQLMSAALLLFLAQQHDQVSLGLLSEQIDHYVQGSPDQETLYGMVNELERAGPSGSLQFEQVMDKVRPLIKSGSLVFLVSDFYSDIEVIRHEVAKLKGKGCECFLLQIVDPREVDFDFDEETTLIDLEDGEKLSINPLELKRQYMERFNAQVQALEEIAREHQGAYLQMRTDSMPLDQFAAFLIKRNELA